jgi:hypothetical protein
LCMICCCVLAFAPAVAALGGDQGWITVYCNVNGASVKMDGDYKGTISGGSLTVPVYTTGTPVNSVTVELSGYTSFSSAVTMPSAGETTTIYATLYPITTPTQTSYGWISVSSQPSGAEIYFNGNYRGHAPLTISDVWPGTYTIEAEQSGYQPYTTTVYVSTGQQSTVYCPLTRLDTSGALYVMSAPSGSSITLDGVYKGSTPLTLNNLASGTHILQIDHAGYYDWKSTVEVPAGGTKTISATLNPMPSSTTGWLYISSSPGGASVSLDGSSMGVTPVSGSLKLNAIAAGNHAVLLSLAGYQPYSTTASVTANTVTEVSAILQPVSSTTGTGGLTVTSTPSQANLFIDNKFVGLTPLTLNDIPAGNHVVTLQLEGYGDYTVTTPVNTGAVSTVSAALTKTTPTPRSGMVPFTVAGALCIALIVAARKYR